MATERDNEHEDVDDDEAEEGGSSDNGRQLRRAAAIAAASGATAFAARKLMQTRDSDGHNGNSRASSGDSHSHAKSLVVAAVSSGWDVAKDTLIPVVEEAASKAGAYVAKRSPDVVRDVVVPNFIDGFEKSRRGGRTRTRRASTTETADE